MEMVFVYILGGTGMDMDALNVRPLNVPMTLPDVTHGEYTVNDEAELRDWAEANTDWFAIKEVL